MESVREFEGLPDLKHLTEPRRLRILRLLMKRDMTLTQLGGQLQMHPAKVRYHLKLLEADGLVRLERTQVVSGHVEKYYRASAGAYRGCFTILPQPSPRGSIIATGSHDLALDALSQALCEDEDTPDMVSIPVGSINGLISLRQGLGHLAGIHLLDTESQQYNIPFVRHFFPDRKMKVINLVTRQQGFVVSPGNPLSIKGISDLTRDDVQFMNRNDGSGTRLWLEHALKERKIDPATVQGFSRTVNTHLDVAASVAQGEAEVGIAVQAAAQKYGLDFVPLFEERYDLVLPAESLDQPLLAPMFDLLTSKAFRQEVQRLEGYDVRWAGTFHEVT